MPPVPVLRPREVVRAFEKMGWQVARQRGSHIILAKPGHIATLLFRTTPRLPVAPCDHSLLALAFQ